MKLDKEFLDKKYKEYFEKHGHKATHVFVYSKEQREQVVKVSVEHGLLYTNYAIVGTVIDHERQQIRIYTEMREPKYGVEFNFNDTEFVCVGCYSDIK